jgi:hypothetical protein
MRGGFAGALLILSGVWANAQQQPDPFSLPPPTQRPQPAPGQPGQDAAALTMEVLGRQGFDVKAVTRASERTGGFLVLMQRAGEVRTCLMRIERAEGRVPRRASVCF